MPLSPARTLLCGTRYALYFNGIGNYVVISNPTEFQLSEFSIELWINAISIGGRGAQCIIAPYPHAWSKYGWLIWTNAPYNNFLLRWNYDGGGENINVGAIYKTGWRHVVFTYSENNNEAKAYLDSELVNTVTPITPYVKGHTTTFYIDYNKTFEGDVGILRFYSRVLKAKEIAQNFNHRDNPVRNGLTLWLHWDSIDIDAGMWYDKTVFGNHGTIYGATLIEPIRLKARTLSPVRTLSPLR